MNGEDIQQIAAEELEQVGGGFPFLALPAVVAYIDVEAIVAASAG